MARGTPDRAHTLVILDMLQHVELEANALPKYIESAPNNVDIILMMGWLWVVRSGVPLDIRANAVKS